MNLAKRAHQAGWGWLLAALLVAGVVYAPGLSGGFLFDDYPNIVDNHGVQPHDATLGSLVGAALSSPASDFKRPLASLSFAANYLATGLDPYWMKLTNLAIHLANGLLTFLLTRILLELAGVAERRRGVLAAWIAGAWLVLPINLTGVLYVVQRMESMADTFVLLGLIGYVAARRWMQRETATPHRARRLGGLAACAASLIVPAAIGMLAKETAVLLPLYAAAIEWILLAFRTRGGRDRAVIGLFVVVLVLPLIVGLAWLLPTILSPASWATRDFVLSTRLLSEARIVTDYVGWTLLPLPGELSFYHDDFRISLGLLQPWTTLAGLVALSAMAIAAVVLRKSRPLVALGIVLFLGCHLLTGTVLPLELVYEHRNYFASFGLLLALVPLLADVRHQLPRAGRAAGYLLLVVLGLWWTTLTARTAYAWGDPLRLARELAERASESPRAQYELGRTYIIYSHYDPNSPYTEAAYAPLERAAAMPRSSILPQQALIFMNSRMQRPLKEAWWDSMIAKLAARDPGVQDESSLASLTQCARERECDLPENRMVAAYRAALAHPSPSPRLLASYADYAWNVLQDRPLGTALIERAARAQPDEPAYQITLFRWSMAQGRIAAARLAIKHLEGLNVGGRLDPQLRSFREVLRVHSTRAQSSPPCSNAGTACSPPGD